MVEATGRDVVRWRCHTRVEKLTVPVGLRPEILGWLRQLPGEEQAQWLRTYGVVPDVTERAGNLLLFGGVACLWQSLIGNGTGTAGQTLTFYNNGNAQIGVGDSAAAAAGTQTDLQASANKLRKAMDSTYPQHADGTVSGAASIAFRATFGTTEANWAWQEWGIFNAAAGGRMLNRAVQNLGVKTSAGVWQPTMTLTLA